MRIAIFFVALAVIATSSHAQANPAPTPSHAGVQFWTDTIGESPIYPIGDAVPVYRAVLDLIYLDGNKRPPVIIMLDSAERRAYGPCPFERCPTGGPWTHKSKMDTATVQAFARMTIKRPKLVQFGYPIPIVYISYDDVKRMEADGRELNAAHPMPNDLPKHGLGVWYALQQKYPGSWGVTILSKVAFNKQRTEALVQAHQWCGDECRVHETLFLKQTKGRWRVVERIPDDVTVGTLPWLRYVGPVGTTPKDSEILPVDKPGVPSEGTARREVYRTVLDSLYSVNGERPKRIVLTNWQWLPVEIPAHTSEIDPALVKRFSFLGGIRAPFDAITKYSTPISTLPIDSVPALRQRGVKLDVEQTGFPFWIAFTKKYPGAWGMLGVSKIAFNPDRTQALVNTYHMCGDSCLGRDIWFLKRSGQTWQIAERIPVAKQPYVEVEPLRYLGVDVNPAAYKPRRVQGIVTEAETGQPIPHLIIRVRRVLNSGFNVDDPSLRTDSLGHFTLTRLPLDAGMTLVFECPNHSPDGRMFVPLAVTPGLDTTINVPFSLAACNYNPPTDSTGRSGVSSTAHGPWSPQRSMWMYFTPVAKPDLRTRTSTCLNRIPGNDAYPPEEVVVRAMTESGESPFLISTSALATARWFGPVTTTPIVRGAFVIGGPSGKLAVSESSQIS